MGEWENSVLKVKSSIVIEVIKVISNFFFFFTKEFYKHKKYKKHKNAYKQKKIKKTAFLCA